MMTIDALQQMVEQNFEVTEDGHARLRSDYRSLERRVEAVETSRAHSDERLSRIETRLAQPTEVSSLRITPGMVFAIVALCASVIGGQYASTYGIRQEQAAMRSDVRDLSTMFVAQAKLQEERAAALNTLADLIQKKQEMQRLEIQSLREMVLALRGR